MGRSQNFGLKDAYGIAYSFCVQAYIMEIYLLDFNSFLATRHSMALSTSTTKISCKTSANSIFQYKKLKPQNQSLNIVTRCESKESSETKLPAKATKLEIGSAVIVTEAPVMIKTAASVPCLRVNSGLVKPGDVGR